MNENIIKKPFKKYDLEDKEKLIYTMRLNKEEKISLHKAMTLLNQPKESTALKQLALIGIDVLQRNNMTLPLNIISSNFRKNGKYTGLDIFKNDKL